jgi:hypothetical protein
VRVRVRVELENVPLQGWNLEPALRVTRTVSRIIGKGASLDYIEARSVRKESTDLLWACVWTDRQGDNPSCMSWVTLPARVPPGASSTARGRRGHRHRVLSHLAIVEAFTSTDERGNPPSPYELPFTLGEVDGAPRERPRSPPPHQEEHRGRRDHDDRGGRDRDRSRGRWRDTLRRSLSRNRRGDGHGDGHEGQDAWDRRESSDRRRRGAHGGVQQDNIQPVLMEATEASVDARASALAALDARLAEATAAGSFELGMHACGAQGAWHGSKAVPTL